MTLLALPWPPQLLPYTAPPLHPIHSSAPASESVLALALWFAFEPDCTFAAVSTCVALSQPLPPPPLIVFCILAFNCTTSYNAFWHSCLPTVCVGTQPEQGSETGADEELLLYRALHMPRQMAVQPCCLALTMTRWHSTA